MELLFGRCIELPRTHSGDVSPESRVSGQGGDVRAASGLVETIEIVRGVRPFPVATVFEDIEGGDQSGGRNGGKQ